MLDPNIPKKYRDKDIDALPPWWKRQFEEEVKAGNFMDGDGTPLLIMGKNDPVGHTYMIMNCLHLAGYKCVCVSLYEIINFMAQKDPVLSQIGGWQEFERATSFFMYDFFAAPPLSAQDTFTVYSFMQQVIASGQTLLLAHDGDMTDLDVHGEHIAQLIEQKFEAIDGNKSEDNKHPILKKAKR